MISFWSTSKIVSDLFMVLLLFLFQLCTFVFKHFFLGNTLICQGFEEKAV